MAEHVYKLVELTGASGKSIEDAIQNAVVRAAKTIRDLKWFEVIETRGAIKDGKVAEWQVTLKAGFLLEDPK